VGLPNISGRLIPYILTCGPLLLTLAAWMRLYWAPRNQRHALPLLALGIANANAALACGTFLYYELRPSFHFLPPWQDPEILQLGWLFLLAPIGMILGVVALVQGAPKWLIRITRDSVAHTVCSWNDGRHRCLSLAGCETSRSLTMSAVSRVEPLPSNPNSEEEQLFMFMSLSIQRTLLGRQPASRPNSALK